MSLLPRVARVLARWRVPARGSVYSRAPLEAQTRGRADAPTPLAGPLVPSPRPSSPAPVPDTQLFKILATALQVWHFALACALPCV